MEYTSATSATSADKTLARPSIAVRFGLFEEPLSCERVVPDASTELVTGMDPENELGLIHRLTGVEGAPSFEPLTSVLIMSGTPEVSAITPRSLPFLYASARTRCDPATRSTRLARRAHHRQPSDPNRSCRLHCPFLCHFSACVKPIPY
jgi:hypothetical protein